MAIVMAALVAGIHVFGFLKQDVDGRDIGVRKHAVLWTAMPGHDWENLALKFGILRANIEGRNFHGK
jgi:hypothetical protein